MIEHYTNNPEYPASYEVMLLTKDNGLEVIEFIYQRSIWLDDLELDSELNIQQPNTENLEVMVGEYVVYNTIGCCDVNIYTPEDFKTQFIPIS